MIAAAFRFILLIVVVSQLELPAAPRDRLHSRQRGEWKALRLLSAERSQSQAKRLGSDRPRSTAPFRSRARVDRKSARAGGQNKKLQMSQTA